MFTFNSYGDILHFKTRGLQIRHHLWNGHQVRWGLDYMVANKKLHGYENKGGLYYKIVIEKEKFRVQMQN